VSIALIAAGSGHFAALIAGQVPQGAQVLAESELAPTAVLEMLAGLSARIAAVHTPNAWMIVDQGCVVGLLTLVAEPADRAVAIGYGVAQSHRGRGVASQAVEAFLAQMHLDIRVESVLAETSVDNPASQHVLRVNGFLQTGKRLDPEDGELICWRAAAS
jgi:RimJ/RimL family protein N-acetyltransferase